MTRLTDAALDALERMANARRNDNDCDFLFVYEFRDLLAEVRASRSAPGLREAVEALAKECESEAAAHPDSYEWAPAHTAVAKRLRSALSSTGTPATATSPEAWIAGAAAAYLERGLAIDAAAAKARWLRTQVDSGRTDPSYLWEQDRPAPSTGTATGGTFPGDRDVMPSGHTRHCEARKKWGDGECECKRVAS